MSVNRQELVDHLRAIRCGGAVEEAVLQPDLSCTAMTQDHSYMVVAPALVDEPLFDDPIGAIDLQYIISGLQAHAPGAESDDVEVIHDAESGQLVLRPEGETDEFKVNLGAPEIIGTRTSEDAADAVIDLVARGDGQSLPEYKGERITKTQESTSAQEAWIHVDTGGVVVRFGDPRTNVGTVEVPELVGDEEYEIMLQAQQVVRVLSQIDYENAKFILTGPDSVVLVQADPYIYAWNPMESV